MPRLEDDYMDVKKSVSVIIPARNEEENIKNIIDAVLNQKYENFEVIVVDDGSSDRTPEILDGYTDRIKKIRIDEKPEGWCGKNFAVYTGYKNSRNEILAFIDADVYIGPYMLKKAISYMEKNNIDMISFLPKLKMDTFWERVLMHTMGSLIFFFFPPHRVNLPQTKNIMANGQFLLVKRNAYEKINGHIAVKEEVEEDVELARTIRKAGFKYIFVGAFDDMSTRMYTGFSEIIKGWSKGIYIHIKKNSVRVFSLSSLFFIFWIYPYIDFLYDIIKLKLDATAISVALLFLFDFISRASVKHHKFYFIFYPLSSFIIFLLFLYNFYRFFLKRGVLWKGRRYL